MFKLLRILAILCLPLVILYTAGIYIRNKLYDWGIRKACDIHWPVISIGNIQVGGTGKTPLAEFIARRLLAAGRQPVILTRGYGRQASDFVVLDRNSPEHADPLLTGDEPSLLHRNIPEAVIAIHADRCHSARQLSGKLENPVFILDDGFQHRQMSRDLDIVLVDANQWSIIPFLFPLTNFRDVKSSLNRAHFLILSRPLESAETIKARLEQRYHKPVFSMSFRPDRLQNLKSDREFSVDHLKGKKAGAFCGIGSPAYFFQMVKRLGCRLQWEKKFPDHHVYSQEEMERLLESAKINGTEVIITTQKDAVKLTRLWPDSFSEIYYLKVKIFLDDENQFLASLDRFLNYGLLDKK